MATIIFRSSESATFVIQNVDLKTNEVQIVDHLHITNDRLYYFNTRYYNSVRDVCITSATFRQVHFGTDRYIINNKQLETLMATGCSEAEQDYGSHKCQVYVGKFFEQVAKMEGDKSLAQCYAEIEKKREEYHKVCNIQNTLLAIGSGAVTKPTECDTDTLAADIETFLKHRKKCLAALKSKKRA